MTQTLAQMRGSSLSDYDFTTMLMQIAPQVTTRKVLLVGHSQGALYANSMYTYLLGHGEPAGAVGAYLVAAPVTSVAGGGAYLSSSNDSVLTALRAAGGKFLDPNIYISKQPGDNSYPGHSFSGAYLAGASERIVGDIRSALQGLAAGEPTDGACFTPPGDTLGYIAQKVAFAVADFEADNLKYKVVGVAAAGTAAVQLARKVAADIGTVVGGVAGLSRAAEAQSQDVNFDIVRKLYGLSVTPQEYADYIKDLGSAVALAPVAHAEVPTQAPMQAQASIPKEIPAPLFSGSGGARHSSDTGEAEDTPEIAPADTPEEPAEPDTEPATTTEPEASSTPPVSDPSVIASQPDDSHFCKDPEWETWFNCYVPVDWDTGTGIFIKDLGNGLSGNLDRITIAHEGGAAAFNPWLITLSCFTDAGYSQPCLDWVAPETRETRPEWAAIHREFLGRADLIAQFAFETTDGKYWWAPFLHSTNGGTRFPRSFDGTRPVRFNPAYYYRLVVNDQAWGVGVYGSDTEPYWLISAAL